MRRLRARWPVLLGFGLLLTLLLAGCDTSTINAPPPALHLGGSVALALAAEPGSLLPRLASDAATAQVEAAIWAPLFYTDDHLIVQPGLATEVPSLENGDISPDGKTITIRLRSGLKWSDGQPLTAMDVAYTINILQDVDYLPQNTFPGSAILDVAVPDAYTVVLTLAKPDATLLLRGFVGTPAFAPLPKHVYGAIAPADLMTAPASMQPVVTSGPFTVAARPPGSDISLAKNPHYYQAPKPYLDGVVFKVFPDTPALVAALESGAVDAAAALPLSTYADVATLSGYKLQPAANASSFAAWYLNLSNPILQDAAVREALAISFDTSPLLTTLWHGLAQPTCDDAVGTVAHEPALVGAGGRCGYGPDGKSFDVAAANALLEADGWTRGADGVRAKGAQRLALRVTVEQGNDEQLAAEQQAGTNWQAIGVAVEVRNTTAAALRGPLLYPISGNGNSNFDVVELQNSLAGDPDSHRLYSSDDTPQHGGANLMFYANPQVDGWEKQQLTTLDPTARAQLFHQIHVQVLKDVPLIFLYAAPELAVAKTTLHGYMPSGVGPSATWNIADWWSEGGTATPTATPAGA
jgi:peptide/nickel transport system substrate-binding protein